MATPREGPNPLRPYYIPPSIGVPSNAAPNATSSPSFSFPNLDYSDYMPDASPSVAASAKSLLDQAVWKYTTVLLAQPFEVAKLILQVHVAQDDETSGRVVLESRQRNGLSSRERNYVDEEEDEEDHSSDDEPNFFTSSTPFAESPSSRSPRRGRQGRPQRHVTDRGGYIPSDHSASSPHRIQLK